MQHDAMRPFDFKNREQVLGLIERADDNQETMDLISYFKGLQNERSPMFLEKYELENILKWKLRRQFGRQQNLRQLNTDEIIKKVTKLVFEIAHINEDYETELKLKILSGLKGIGIPVASAILTLTNPERYAVIDYRVWRQLFNTKKSSYTTTDYLKYLHKIKQLSIRYGLNTQQIDMAIWRYDVEQNK